MASTASAVTTDSQFTKDSYIPIFDGQPSSYQEWRKRIHIYYMKMKIQKRTTKSVLNLISSLQGNAWKLLEGYDLTKVEDDQAFDKIISMLDTAFQYDIRVRIPQDFDAYFNLSRRPGTSLLSFVTEHEEKLRKFTEHGIKLPDQIQGWRLLRRANLTKEQNQFVLTQAPKLEKLRVQEALFVILGQDYKSAVSHDRRPFANNRFQRGKAFAAHDHETFDDLDIYEDGYYEYDDQYETEVYDESWADDSFDADIGYFQEDEAALEFDQHSEAFDINTYDEAFAAYLDARRRFQDLKLSRGFLPVVALADQNPVFPSSNSSPSSRGRGKGFGKPKGKSKGKGRGSNVVRYPSRGECKAPDPRARAAAASQCLRCGAFGHQAAQCPRPAKHSGSSQVSTSPSKKQNTEAMAATQLPDEHGYILFEDQLGRPRVDCTMMDPGASAFLMGAGPFHRYVEHFKQLGFAVETIKMRRTCRTFHFGGDHLTMSHWITRVPIFLNNNFGFDQAFIIKGETPILMGRPIIEALGIVINFKRQQMIFEGHPWRQITIGRHGEYLLSLTEDYEAELADQVPSFDLRLENQSDEFQSSGEVMDFQAYQKQEGVFNSNDDSPTQPGERPVLIKH